jgi:hypothetical protein
MFYIGGYEEVSAKDLLKGMLLLVYEARLAQ